MFKSYIICGTPRSGSTLLCRLLASTGVAGKPDSFFRRQSVSEWMDDWGLPARETMTDSEFARTYLGAACGEGENGTGIFGLRLMRENLEDATGMIDTVYPGLPDDVARFEKAFGRTLFIHLSRGDKVAQAVSRVKAEQTGLWHLAPDGTELERLSPPAHPVYDHDAIDKHVTELEQYDDAWNQWFVACGIDPVRITYEMLSGDPASVLALILDRLGLDSAIASDAVPEVAKLADATSAEWIARYRWEKAGRRRD